ncbi:nucleotide sugar dehydrogenase [Altererythrobacter litoralis]|uniref:UDP-glucose 6-dehydrogenase n=1 Tax=Altererythrobacter litoralis TaxID=3113904 RepID=A0ABU7GF89_9SPHN|nr:nucleotide sugar dehydrogenase [Erythrobacteraceae bacterium 1XM1-14]
MRISIFGMGYVGVVSAACLLRDGHIITGIDPVQSKVDDLAEGRSPISEHGVPEMLATGHADGRLFAATDPFEGVNNADLIFVCVGTPSDPDGGINLSHVISCMGEIGRALKHTVSRPLIVLRSTSLPGTTEALVIPTLEKESGLKVGNDFDVVFHPEFLRESSAVRDFDEPPKIVLGEGRNGAGDRLMEIYTTKYEAPRWRVGLAEAELVKYADNLFHAVKVTFANELGAIARSVGIDARRVADVFCSDKKLNISARYLRPGFAYGGSCLPKDLSAINRFCSLKAIETPMLKGVLESNAVQIDQFAKRILNTGFNTIGIVGLAFKSGTDDMRESPYLNVAKILCGEGKALQVFDPGVDISRLIGSNRDMVQAALGHLEPFMVPSLEDLSKCELILINHRIVSADQVMAWLESGKKVFDLASIEGVDTGSNSYEGIYW